MKLAMEVPYAHLRLFASLTDFDFAIAPTVLEKGQKSIYVKWLQKQADKGREVWLDNGWFELKRSLSQDQLIKAAKMIHATHIVAPEVLNDSEQTLFHIMELKDYILRNDLNIKVVGSWQGFLKDLITLKTICNEVAMPRDRQRHRYVYNMKTEVEAQSSKLPSQSFHYFGFTNLDELRLRPPKSLDTGMPIKAAMEGIDLSIRERRPKVRPLDFTVKLSKPVLDLAIKNTKLIKEASSCMLT